MLRSSSLFVAVLCCPWHAQGQTVIKATPTSISFGSQFVGKTTSPLTYTAGNYPDALATGDFNGDGKLDIAVVNADGNNISVFFGKGDGTFQPAVNYGDTEGPAYIVAADLNGDGKPDLAVANHKSSVGVFLNNGEGTFSQGPTDYSTGSGTMSVAVRDVNSDGIPDLVTANYSGHSVSVLLGKGDGTFLNSATLKVGASAYSVTLGDFNGDGKIDIAVSLQLNASGSVGVLLGNGNGTFQQVITSPTGESPTSLVATDFNGDGKLDLAMGSEGSATGAGSSLCVLLGKGDGTFQPPVKYAVGKYPTNTVAADFNGDGKEDVAVISYGAADFNVLLGNGDGTLQSPVAYVTQLLPYAIAAGDFTGNGVMDLVAVDPYFVGNVFLGNGDGTFQDYLLMLTNTGSTGAHLKFSIAGTDAKDFAISGSCPFLGPSGNCILQTMFTPKATGLRTASLQVMDNAGHLLTSVGLTGTGK
jgi:hypothetical protein